MGRCRDLGLRRCEDPKDAAFTDGEPDPGADIGSTAGKFALHGISF
jgi:hypothetical protein